MFIDISKLLTHPLATYPGDPKYVFEHVKHVKKDGVTVSRIDCGLHTSTHLDTPAHFIEGGKEIIDFPIDAFTGRAHVIDCTSADRFIEASLLTAYCVLRTTGDIILLKTKNSLDDPTKFNEAFVSLAPEAASFLVKQGIKAVGTDGPSIDRFHSGNHPTHLVLMKSNVLIYENLSLKDVAPGTYTFHGFPLKIEHGEASPVRAVLEKT
jgi:arylformamidase